jgi:hypothetical protein
LSLERTRTPSLASSISRSQNDTPALTVSPELPKQSWVVRSPRLSPVRRNAPAPREASRSDREHRSALDRPCGPETAAETPSSVRYRHQLTTEVAPHRRPLLSQQAAEAIRADSNDPETPPAAETTFRLPGLRPLAPAETVTAGRSRSKQDPSLTEVRPVGPSRTPVHHPPKRVAFERRAEPTPATEAAEAPARDAHPSPTRHRSDPPTTSSMRWPREPSRLQGFTPHGNPPLARQRFRPTCGA